MPTRQVAVAQEGAPTRDARPARAIAYLRVSTLAQQKDGKNLDQQLTEIQAYCRTKGYHLSGRDIYKDIISGARRDRDDYYRLLNRIEKADAQVIVAYEVSRYGRNGLDNAWLLVKAKEHGFRLETVTGGRDFLADPESEFMFDILSAVAKYERNALFHRLTRGKKAAHKRGHWTVGAPPYGYEASGARGAKTLRIVPHEAQIVQRAFALYLEGWGYKRIADAFQREAVDPARKWSPAGVGIILTNPVYRGLLVWEDDVVQGQHEPIITELVWEKAQVRREQMRARHPGRPKKGE